MRNAQKFWKTCGSLALAGVFAGVTVISGCAARTRYRAYDFRVYDPEYHDYHRWDHERRYYIRWEDQTHRYHRDFRDRDRHEQEEYWEWRHRHHHHDWDWDRDRDRDDYPHW